MTGSPPLLLNPNFPPVSVEVDCSQGPPTLPGPARLSLNARSRLMTVREIDIKFGRQYETNQFDAGTAKLTVLDPLELINPANTASVFNSGANLIDAYRCIGIYAYWPLAGNLWTATVQAGLDPSFETSTSALTAPGGTTVVLSSAQAWTGTHSALVTQASAGSSAWPTVTVPTLPGVAHTASIYVYPTGTASVIVSVIDEAGVIQSSAAGATPGVWQRISLTWTAADCLSTLTLAGTGTATPTYYLDGAQYQFGSLVTAWTATGPTRWPLFVGYVEQWPQDWDKGGNRGVRQIECVDALSILSRTQITLSYATTILADTPTVYLPFSDAGPPIGVQMPAGGQPGYGYAVAGNNQGSINYGGDSFLDGTPALSLNQQNANPAVSGNTAYTTTVGTRGALVSLSPQGATLECWVKVTAGTAYLGAGALQPGEVLETESAGPQYGMGWYTSAGKLTMRYTDPNGSGTAFFAIGNGGRYSGYPDGQWHHLVFLFPGGSTVQSYVDGVAGGAPAITGTASQAIGLNDFYVQATTIFGDPLTTIAVANMAFYPAALSSTRIRAHYQRGIGYRGEVSGARVARLLTQYWGGGFSAAPGVLALAEDFGYVGRFVLDVLQEITASENGQCYADTAGSLVWEDRVSRYTTQIPHYVFGERADLGEIPYTKLQYGKDPTYTYSQANLSRPDSNQTLVYPNPPPATPRYGQRIQSQTIQCTTDFDLSMAAQFYTTRYAAPALRVKALSVQPSTLNPATVANAWPALLGLQISQRHTVTRRTPAGVTMTGDHYVESFNHKINGQNQSWSVDLQMSPVFVPTAWVLGDATFGVLGSSTVPVY